MSFLLDDLLSFTMETFSIFFSLKRAKDLFLTSKSGCSNSSEYGSVILNCDAIPGVSLNC